MSAPEKLRINVPESEIPAMLGRAAAQFSPVLARSFLELCREHHRLWAEYQRAQRVDPAAAFPLTKVNQGAMLSLLPLASDIWWRFEMEVRARNEFHDPPSGN